MFLVPVLLDLSCAMVKEGVWTAATSWDHPVSRKLPEKKVRDRGAGGQQKVTQRVFPKEPDLFMTFPPGVKLS